MFLLNFINLLESTMNLTYLTAEELGARIKYDPRTIRNRLKDTVLIEGIHYIRPFGQRRILFIWERIEEDMQQISNEANSRYDKIALQ